MPGLARSCGDPELKNREDCDKIGDGSVAEWLKAHDSKSCGRVTVSEVRILSLPPRLQRVVFFGFVLRIESSRFRHALSEHHKKQDIVLRFAQIESSRFRHESSGSFFYLVWFVFWNRWSASVCCLISDTVRPLY